MGVDVNSLKTVEDEVIGAVISTDKLCELIEELRKELRELKVMKQKSEDLLSRPNSQGEQDRGQRNDINCDQCGRKGHVDR